MSHPTNATHRPADNGLTGLGLIMQLGGSLFAAMTAMVGFTQILMISEMSSRSRGWGGENPYDGLTPWLFLLMAAGVGRSLAHRAAGTELLYGMQPVAAVRRYCLVGFAHAALWVAFFMVKFSAPAAAWAPIGLTFLAWPLALFIISLQRGIMPTPDEHGFARVPPTGDRGFEGMAVLMLIFGIAGALYTGIMLMAFLDIPSAARTGSFTLLMMATAFLMVRGLIHAHAGASLLGELTLDRLDTNVNRYVNVGVISSLVFGGAFMVVLGAIPGGGMLLIMPMLIGLVLMLLAWPVAVRQLVMSRRMELYAEAGTVPALSPSPDQGRTTLGWFLLAMGAWAAAGALSQVMFEGEEIRGKAADFVEMVGNAFSSGESRKPLLGLGVAIVQIWAAIELIYMTPRHRHVATGYGVAAVCVAIYELMPVFDAIDKLGGKALQVGGGGNTMVLALLALTLIIPLSTLIMVNRNLPPPRPTAGIANVFS